MGGANLPMFSNFPGWFTKNNAKRWGCYPLVNYDGENGPFEDGFPNGPNDNGDFSLLVSLPECI